MVLNWLKDETTEDNLDRNDLLIGGEEMNPQIKNKTKKGQREELMERHKFLIQFYQSLPKVPSHYCRASSKKLFLEPDRILKRQFHFLLRKLV